LYVWTLNLHFTLKKKKKYNQVKETRNYLLTSNYLSNNSRAKTKTSEFVYTQAFKIKFR
jgi:hypothetical protein